MAKIFSAPDTIKPPVFNVRNLVETKENEKKYIEAVKQYCLTDNPKKDEYTGELFKIPMGDGYAMYMVYSMKPLHLIHLEIGDAWDSPYANNVTSKFVKSHIDGAKKIEKLFGTKSNIK